MKNKFYRFDEIFSKIAEKNCSGRADLEIILSKISKSFFEKKLEQFSISEANKIESRTKNMVEIVRVKIDCACLFQASQCKFCQNQAPTPKPLGLNQPIDALL